MSWYSDTGHSKHLESTESVLSRVPTAKSAALHVVWHECGDRARRASTRSVSPWRLAIYLYVTLTWRQ